MPVVRRVQAGIEIAGNYQGVSLQPAMYEFIRVRAAAFPGPGEPWGWLATRGMNKSFTLEDIAFDDVRLDCWRSPVEEVPAYREGFTLTLEPGMADALRAWLPQVHLSSIVLQAVISRVRRVIGRFPERHEHDYVIAPLVSSCVLDRLSPDDARAAAQWSDGRAMFAPEISHIAGISEVAAVLVHDEKVNAQLARAASGKWLTNVVGRHSV